MGGLARRSMSVCVARKPLGMDFSAQVASSRGRNEGTLGGVCCRE